MVSIRCKSLRKTKAIKRQTNFGQAEQERLLRIVSKLDNLKTHEPENKTPVLEVGDEKPMLMNRNQMKKKKKAQRLSKKRK